MNYCETKRFLISSVWVGQHKLQKRSLFLFTNWYWFTDNMASSKFLSAIHITKINWKLMKCNWVRNLRLGTRSFLTAHCKNLVSKNPVHLGLGSRGTSDPYSCSYVCVSCSLTCICVSAPSFPFDIRRMHVLKRCKHVFSLSFSLHFLNIYAWFFVCIMHIAN